MVCLILPDLDPNSIGGRVSSRPPDLHKSDTLRLNVIVSQLFNVPSTSLAKGYSTRVFLKVSSLEVLIASHCHPSYSAISIDLHSQARDGQAGIRFDVGKSSGAGDHPGDRGGINDGFGAREESTWSGRSKQTALVESAEPIDYLLELSTTVQDLSTQLQHQ